MAPYIELSVLVDCLQQVPATTLQPLPLLYAFALKEKGKVLLGKVPFRVSQKEIVKASARLNVLAI
jgi:hypothetical protein